MSLLSPHLSISIHSWFSASRPDLEHRAGNVPDAIMKLISSQKQHHRSLVEFKRQAPLSRQFDKIGSAADYPMSSLFVARNCMADRPRPNSSKYSRSRGGGGL